MSLLSDSNEDNSSLVRLGLLFAGKLCSMDLKGNNKKEVDSNHLIMSGLYNTPNNKFVKVLFLTSTGLEILEMQ